MNIWIGILALLVTLGIIVTILAFIGLKVKKQEQKWINEYNDEAIKVFKKANENKKFKRASTPKVPAIRNK